MFSPGELYEVQETSWGTIRLWQGQWDEEDEDKHLGDMRQGDFILVIRHGTYDDTWVLTHLGIGLIEGVSGLISKGAILLSRACEGRGASP